MKNAKREKRNIKKDALRSDWFHWTLPQILSLADCSLSMRSSHTKPTEGSHLNLALSVPEMKIGGLSETKQPILQFFDILITEPK
jgi:hypothetical protein